MGETSGVSRTATYGVIGAQYSEGDLGNPSPLVGGNPQPTEVSHQVTRAQVYPLQDPKDDRTKDPKDNRTTVSHYL